MSFAQKMVKRLLEMPHIQVNEYKYIDLRFEHYPLPKKEKDALLLLVSLGPGVVAQDSAGVWWHFNRFDMNEIPDDSPLIDELDHLPDYWEDFVHTLDLSDRSDDTR